MTMDREVRIAGKVPKKVIEGASRECDHGAALGANEVMAVSRLPDDIGGMTTGLEEAGQEINRRENLKRAIDGRATDRGQLFDELLGGKGAAVGKDGLDNLTAGAGQPVTVVIEGAHDVVGGRDLLRVGEGCPVHSEEA